jgi:hypothetical protein
MTRFSLPYSVRIRGRPNWLGQNYWLVEP